METTTNTTPPDVTGVPPPATGSTAWCADDLTVGQLVRWINAQHLTAAKQTPPDTDCMAAYQRLGAGVESALAAFRASGALVDSRGTNDPMTWEYWRDRARLAESRQ